MRNEIDNLLAIYKLDSEPEESVKILKKVSELLPNDTVVQFNYGMALISAG
jgi:hypothetical protein